MLNTITSILKYYKVETKHKSLECLDNKLQNNYKNVVFIVLDGMGEHILQNLSPDGYFKNNQIVSENLYKYLCLHYYLLMLKFLLEGRCNLCLELKKIQ